MRWRVLLAAGLVGTFLGWLHPWLGAAGLLTLAAAVAATSPTETRAAVWTGWALRVAVAVAGLTFLSLPDSRLDAVTFHREALEYAALPFGEWLSAATYHAQIYPWSLGGLYRVAGASPAVGVALNVLLGTVTVRGVGALADELWNQRAARMAGWVAALFPILVLHSAVMLREAPIQVLLVLGTLGVLRSWGTEPRLRVGAIASWVAAVVLLPALQIGFQFVIPFVLLVVALERTPLLRERRGALVIAGLGAGWLLYRLLVATALPQADLFGFQGLDSVQEAQEVRRFGRTAYPEWLTITGIDDALLLMLPRVAAFLVMPLPWQVERPQDLLGMLDGLLYAALVVPLLRLARHLRRPRLVFVLATAGLVLLVYAMGVSNYGTGIRHRAKFAVLLIALAAGPLAVRTDRVVFWISGLGNGGAERQLSEVAARLRERGRSVSVVAFWGGLHERRLREADVPLLLAGRGASLRARLRALREVSRADTVATLLYAPNLGGRLGRVLFGYRLVTCLRSVQFGSPRRHRLLRRTRGQDDAWTSNSNHAATLLVADGVARAGAGSVVPNGIGPRRMRPEPEGPFTWVCVGRLRREKDHATLLRAWARLPERREARLRIVGAGPLEPELRALARELRVRGSVTFVGAVRDAGPEYDRAHAAVLSSWTESSPNSLLEAMAQGRPVVGTAVGGTPDVVPAAAGLLVPARDPDALAAAMARVMRASPEERREMGRAGRRHVRREHGWDRVVDRWEEVLWP